MRATQSPPTLTVGVGSIPGGGALPRRARPAGTVPDSENRFREPGATRACGPASAASVTVPESIPGKPSARPGVAVPELALAGTRSSPARVAALECNQVARVFNGRKE